MKLKPEHKDRWARIKEHGSEILRDKTVPDVVKDSMLREIDACLSPARWPWPMSAEDTQLVKERKPSSNGHDNH